MSDSMSEYESNYDPSDASYSERDGSDAFSGSEGDIHGLRSASARLVLVSRACVICVWLVNNLGSLPQERASIYM